MKSLLLGFKSLYESVHRQVFKGVVINPYFIRLIKRFLEQRPVTYPIALGGLSGTQLGEALGNAQGALPFTVVLAADGRLIMKKLGKLSANEIEKWAV